MRLARVTAAKLAGLLHRGLIIGGAAAGAVIVAAAVAQLLLPGMVAGRVRSRLARQGDVQSVRVYAFPAVKLLWGQADLMTVHMSALRATRTDTGDLLAASAATRDLDASISVLSEGVLTLRNVALSKRGSSLTGQAVMGDADLRAALPPGLAVAPVASGSGELLLRARASLFGFGLAADALLQTRDGAMVVSPVGIPFGALATLTVFSDPRLSVLGVGARPAPGGYTFTAQGRLTGA